MNLREWNVRVVVTEGERSAAFAWLRHASHHVVCGIPDEGAGWHVRYPKDGRAHITTKDGAGNRRAFFRESPVPLDGFVGHRTMLALGIASDTLADMNLQPFKYKTQDVVAFLDLRAFDAKMLWVEFGLLEAHKADALSFDFEVRQLLLEMSTSPWVYIAAGVQEAITR